MRIPGTALQLRAPVDLSRALGSSDQRHLRLIHGGQQHADLAGPPRSTAGIDSHHPFTDIVNGGIDINPELSGSRKYPIFEEMRMSDPAIRSSLWMYKLPVRQADWALDPAGENPDDKIICAATAWQFGLNQEEGQLDLTWDEWIQQSALFFDFGAMFEEMQWGDIQLWKPKGDDGTNSRIIRPIARFAPRFPATIEKVETDTAKGTIKRMRQLIPGADWMPGEQLAWYVLDREGVNWFGTSLLRVMYGSWRLKKALLIASAIGWDRYSSGVPVVRYPAGGGMRNKGEAESIARNYRTHERGYVTFEGKKEDGWDIEIVDGSKTIVDPTSLLHYYDEQIAMGGLQQFMMLGKTKTGSRAVGEVQVDPFYKAVSSFADYIRTCRQRFAIRRFVDVNFGPEYDAPLLRVGKIQHKDVLGQAQAIEMLSSAGLSFTDRRTQNDLRDGLDLAHLPEETAAAIEALPDDVGLEQTPPPKEGSPVVA